MQVELDEEIRRVSNFIDPKLLGYLTFQDIFDDKYSNDDLKHLYNEQVYPLIHEYRVQVQVKTEKYLVDFINDMEILLPNTGYDYRTGEETQSFANFDSIPDEYVPCVEIEPVWKSVLEFRHEVNHIPFWKRHSYTLYGNGETVSVVSAEYPSEFISSNRHSFTKSYGDTNLGKMERSARFKDTHFDYPIYVPALTVYEDRNIPNSYEESVRRHLILKEAMEGTLPDAIVLTSEIDPDGNVKLKPYGGY